MRPEHPKLSNAYVKGPRGVARGPRIPLRSTALNVSVFSLPESYEGRVELFAPSLHWH